MKSDIPLYILVGHKGTGKSALLSVLKSEQDGDEYINISIQPDDIIELNQNENDFLKMIRIWKEGLINIIFQKLMTSISENKHNDSWGKSVIELAIGIIGKKTEDWSKETIGDRRFVKLVKDSLFSRKRITILIDDLDRGWKNTENDIARVSALLNASRDLSREMDNLRFRIAIRSDVYYAVRTSDESTDKIEGSVVWSRWSNHEILVMLIKRIETAQGRDVDESVFLQKNNGNYRNICMICSRKDFKVVGNGKMHQCIK